MSLFYLPWRKCRDGYELITTISGGKDLHIVPKSSAMDDIDDAFQIPGLHRRFALVKHLEPNAKEPNCSALEFVNAYGRLYATAGSAYDTLESALIVRNLLARAAKRDWGFIVAAVMGGDGKEGLGVGNLRMTLRNRGEEKPALRIRAANLWTAILIQLLDEITTGAEYKRCKNPACPEWFIEGEKGHRRNRREFHSEDCRNRFHNALKAAKPARRKK